MSDEVETQELPDIDESIVADDATGEGGVAGAEATANLASESEKPLEVVAGAVTEGAGLGLIMEVPLRLSVEVGTATLPVRDVLALAKGSVVELDRMNGDPADVYVNDRLIARGELEVLEERVAIRITELVAVRAAAGGH